MLDGLNGVYTEWYRLLPGVQQVTGPPPGNTTEQNFCPQATSLDNLDGSAQGWYMIQAVHDHEDVHATRLLPALQNKAAEIEQLMEAVCVPHTPGMTETDAKNAVLASDAYQFARTDAFNVWSEKYADLTDHDDDAGGPTQQAEHAVVDPMVVNICSLSSSQCWFFCNACPARETGACCAPETGVCNIKTDCDCVDGGGEYRGDDTTCGPPNPCQGVCCVPGSNSCQVASESRCTNVLNGTYKGDGTTCATVGCGPPA